MVRWLKFILGLEVVLLQYTSQRPLNGLSYPTNRCHPLASGSKAGTIGRVGQNVVQPGSAAELAWPDRARFTGRLARGSFSANPASLDAIDAVTAMTGATCLRLRPRIHLRGNFSGPFNFWAAEILAFA
jgi:hypothetical protein